MFWHKVAIFAVLCLVSVNSQASGNDCAKDFTKVGDKCLLASNKWYSWYEADRYCHSLGAGLLSLQNQAELTKIESWLSTSVSFRLAEFWTSGNQLGKKGTYFWQSTGELARFLPWSTGEPSATAGDCLSLYPKDYNSSFGYSNYRLIVRSCTYPSPLVCEQKPQKYGQTTTTRICLSPGAYETAQVLV